MPLAAAGALAGCGFALRQSGDYPFKTVLAGFALATEIFPDLMRQEANQLLEPLAAIYRHLDPDDLEDADDAVVDDNAPPADQFLARMGSDLSLAMAAAFAKLQTRK